MAVSKAKKEEVLKGLIEKFQKAKSVVFAKNIGLSVSEISELRQKLREQSVDFKVAKKTLLRLAAKENGIEDIPVELTEGPIGIAFSYENEVAGANILHKFGKETEKVELTGGVLENQVIDQVRVKYLATLPSKEQLIAKLLGSMQAPLSGFQGVLSGVPSAFVRVLNAYKEKKETASK